MELNAYQIYILSELNKLPLMYLNTLMWKQAWLSNNIFETEANLNDWDEKLIVEEYISKEPDFYSQRLASKTLSFKIEQKGRDYLNYLFISKIENISIKSDPSINRNVI